MVKGLYVHIPFCSYRCPYCDFTSLVNSPLSYEDYVDLLIKEAHLYRDVDRSIKTLYLGGGTPTLLPPREIGRLLEGLDRALDLSGVEEVTVECNPETYELGNFKELISYGVSRLSFGVQSFSGKGLSALGRRHSREDVLRAYSQAREAGFRNVNLDLIYGYPGQTPSDVEEELRWVERLKPEHLSAYLLTPHRNTPLGMDILLGKIPVPREEELVSVYTRLWKGLRDIGYGRYELSNWALEGYECRHNLIYWTLEEFLGLGVSAWGFYSKRRYGNTKNMLSYARTVMEGRRPVESEVSLSDEDLFEEFVMLRLRLREGLPHQMEGLIPERLKNFFERGEKGTGIREEFMLLADEIIGEVLVYNSHRDTGR